jgi:hypothetical protein
MATFLAAILLSARWPRLPISLAVHLNWIDPSGDVGAKIQLFNVLI